MKKYINMSLMMALTTVFTFGFFACGDDDVTNKDMQKPVISSEGIPANPINCQQYYRGDVIPFHYILSDDEELGSYNIEIHSNFDHHTHSTESSADCHSGEEEHTTPVNPWVFNHDYIIAGGQKRYEARQNIDIPTDIDPGDYHFVIRVTDKTGWQQILAVEIEIE